MKKTANIIIRVDNDLKDAFFNFAEKNDVTVSALLNACMADLIKRNKIPMYLYPHLFLYRKPKEDILDIEEIKHLLLEAMENTNTKYKIDRAYLFGSYSRGEANENSDIDFRIEVNDKFSLFDLSNLIKELKELTKKNIDIATQDPSEMDEGFYNNIRKEEICIYELSRQSNNSTCEQTL